MAKLKFKDEDGEFIPVVQDVLVNNNSVFDGKDANIELKTINSQSITGSGNIEISPSSKVDILLSTTPDQEGFYHSKYSPSELWDMYNDEETFLTIDGQLIANATYENGEFSCALLFAKEIWTPIYVTMYVVRPNDDNKLRKMSNMPAASADFTINGHKLSDNMGVMTLTPEDLAYVNTIKGTSVTNAKGALDTLTTNVNALSTVEANPTLAGTESDLTALEVAGTKYKIPSGGGGGGGNTTTIQTSWSTMPQNPNVGDRVTNVNDNSGTPGGGGGGNSTVVQTSWDNMPENPSVGDRVTNLNDISGFKFLQPEIDVSAPVGTTITVTDGSTSYTKTSTETVTKFNVNDYGSWTVSGIVDSVHVSRVLDVRAVQIYDTKLSRLPSAYQEVEYLASTGTQYIDTLINMATDMEAEFDIAITDINSASSTKGYFGARFSSGDKWYPQEILTASSNVYFRYGNGATPPSVTWSGVQLNQAYNVKYSIHNGNFSIDIDGTNILQSAGTTYAANISYLIFATHSLEYDGRININPYNCKFYTFKLSTGGELRRNMIPCYRKVDDVAGLYDLENDEFYTNQGSGTFTVGPDVN